MRLTKMQATALISKIQKDLKDQQKLETAEIINAYVPSKEYKHFETKFDEVYEKFKEVNDLLNKTLNKTHCNIGKIEYKTYYLDAIRNKELESRLNKIQRYDLENIDTKVVMATIECTNLDEIIKKVIESSKL